MSHGATMGYGMEAALTDCTGARVVPNILERAVGSVGFPIRDKVVRWTQANALMPATPLVCPEGHRRAA